MKTLSALQQELKEVVQKINNITEDINSITEEIRILEEMSRPVENGEIDFEMIKITAQSRLYKGHALENEEDIIKTNYLSVLFWILADEANPDDMLSYIFKIGYSAGYSEDMKELYFKAITLTPAQLNSCLTPIRDRKLAEVLAVDVLIMMKRYMNEMSGGIKSAKKIITLLGLDSEQNDFVKTFSDVIVTENIADFSSERKFIDDEYSCYINDSAVIKKNVEKARSVFYLHIQPDGLLIRNINNKKMYSFNGYDKIKILNNNCFSARLKINIKAMLGTNVPKNMMINYPIPEGYEFETISGEMSASWVPAAGYFHSALDTKALCEEWYNNQPKTDPQYDCIDDEELYNIAQKEQWSKDYTSIDAT